MLSLLIVVHRIIQFKFLIKKADKIIVNSLEFQKEFYLKSKQCTSLLHNVHIFTITVLVLCTHVLKSIEIQPNILHMYSFIRL